MFVAIVAWTEYLNAQQLRQLILEPPNSTIHNLCVAPDHQKSQ